uniref:Uncharacterized protein n=1 Tax=Romanomermis culicivorax TaxID=13658 RepID=A0A915ILS5_ROMCU
MPCSWSRKARRMNSPAHSYTKVRSKAEAYTSVNVLGMGLESTLSNAMSMVSEKPLDEQPGQ